MRRTAGFDPRTQSSPSWSADSAVIGAIVLSRAIIMIVRSSDRRLASTDHMQVLRLALAAHRFISIPQKTGDLPTDRCQGGALQCPCLACALLCFLELPHSLRPIICADATIATTFSCRFHLFLGLEIRPEGKRKMPRKVDPNRRQMVYMQQCPGAQTDESLAGRGKSGCRLGNEAVG